VYVLFGMLDYKIVPFTYKKTFIIRLVFVISCTFYYGISYFQFFKKHFQTFLAFGGIIATHSVLLMIALAKPNELGYYLYYASPTIALSGITITKLRFKSALLVILATIFNYGIVAIFVQHLTSSNDFMIFSNNMSFLITAGIIGAINTYTFENYSRQEFMQLKLILDEKNTIERKNAEILEQKEELQTNRDELKELNATKDRLFSIIGHDLKNPFTVIMSLSEIVYKDFDGFEQEEIKDSINRIYSSSKNGVELLDNLLQWARVQRIKTEITPEPINLRELTARHVQVFSANAREKEIEIISNIDGNLEVYADKNMISTILRNLLSNSIKFSHPKGLIKIEASEKMKNGCKFVEIRVSDTGTGIEEGNLRNLFKMDSSFSTPGTNKEIGTGLGLLLCKELVEKNGGEIVINSYPGEGCQVNFTLPAP
jgi:signal transduction histidine kinase